MMARLFLAVSVAAAAVPAFDDSRPIAFMDGECALCTGGARLISRFDRRSEIRICPTQSKLGQAVLRHYGLDPTDPDSWLFLSDGKATTSMDAIIRVGERMGGPGRLAGGLRVLPRSARDWLYRRIARNRYAVLGRTDMCAVPDKALQQRLMQ